METTYIQAAWFLPAALPICLFAAWNDMKDMKIPNFVTLALLVSFLVLGPFALGLETFLWRLLHFAVVLVAGFILSVIGRVGAGDAKFAAAMAPFIAYDDMKLFAGLLAASLLAAFFGHRLLRMIPQVQLMTPDWRSWQDHQFPAGLALGLSLVLYLGMAFQQG
ncbi:prepilin peptidase [Thalassobius sp. I31.1]|uniref:A24 family peptidase n=1 Tax=Thalassobius sp. I31.1 TaxID=2109912 RepID=UPI000D1C0145|nr:prepilin peptidase [Thalassobius sp. I31.1]